MVYNHTYMPMGYGRDPRDDYRALVERVTLWDVGAERQCELRGPGALVLADHLAPRRLTDLEVGECRYTPVCDRAGAIMCECIVLRPWDDVVWFSHSDVDLTLWAVGIALARGDEATVAEADVAPVQLQGPRASDVLSGLADRDLAELGRHRCAPMRIAGVEAVVSNTGWSREPGFEIYPLGSGRAVELWDALCAAGEPHGLLVTGPNIVRAVEQGISDTQYATNSDMNPIEAGIGPLLDLDRDFVGGDALRAVREHGAARQMVGLVCDGEPFPAMDRYWPVTTADGADAGVARWAVYSFALERNIAVCLVAAGTDAAAGLVVQAPDGPRRGEPHPTPFV
jgi:glycine cleavage system aminomethyltransferase T